MQLKPLLFGAMLAAFSSHAFAAEQTATFSVPGMNCASCPYLVQSAMSAVEGVQSVETSLEDRTASVVFDDALTTPDAIALASTNAGYAAELIENSNDS
ncbi:heavy-metal-associated domain-containing protein [Leisingera sp. S232]|uniref:heavy-metal-associated domain-containing protein n=1 Tax=Leisingera sp. S232 TaxID=3415132 RepID=UPI003C7D4725